jgi:hypothetical protein
MKKIYLLIAMSIVILSCSKNSNQINVAKNEVEKYVSELERKSIKYTCIEMSDREAYNEIADYHKKRQEKAEKEYDEFMEKFELGKYRITPLEEMESYELENTVKLMKFGETYLADVSQSQNLYSKDINALSKLKGKNTYYKILAVKTTPDTVFYKKFYLDNNNKIINTQMLK